MRIFVFLLRRIFWSLLVLVGLSMVIFTIARGMPGDAARMALGPTASAAQVAQMREQMGLDQPLTVQYLRYVGGLAQGDLGVSLLTNRSVTSDIAQTFMATFELVMATITIAFVVGLPLGMAAAFWKDRWPDTMIRILSLVSAVAPTFLLALLFQILAGYVLNVLPTTGRLSIGTGFEPHYTGLLTVDAILQGRWDILADALRHLLLPALALSSASVGQIALTTRAAMIDVTSQDYIEAARAFGIPDWIRTVKYTLRPALIAPMTILGLSFAALIGNAFVVEMIFGWPGMAAYGVRTILQKDLNAIMGVVMVSGVFFVTINLAIDLLAGLIDPRVRMGGERS